MNDYQKIEKSILYLEKNFSRQPTLREVAAHIGLSEYHFQRLFKRWAGISPKRYLQYVTAQFCGNLLRDSTPTLETSLEAGFSSSSRLHDLIVNVYAMTPQEYRLFGKDLTIQYGWHHSPFGLCLVGLTSRGLCWLSFHENQSGLTALKKQWSAAHTELCSRNTKDIVNQIFANSSDQSKPFNLHVKGTNLQIRVWEALLATSTGEVLSYSQLAQAVNQPKATRAVASAVGKNAISYIIPCHRVIRKSGAIGGYRWGVTRKRAILAWEAAQ